MVSRVSLLVALACLAPGLAQAQGDEAPVEAAQAAEQRSFSVPAGPLGTALTVFGRQAGLQVSVDPALVQGVASPGVSGTLPVDQAMARLLAGTGLAHRIVGNTVTLQRPGASSGSTMTLDPVHAGGAAAGAPRGSIKNPAGIFARAPKIESHRLIRLTLSHLPRGAFVRLHRRP